MTKSMTILGTAGLLIAAAFPVSAHHSFSAEFDVDKPVKLEGTVVKMDWVNPHTWLYIDVKEAGRYGRALAGGRRSAGRPAEERLDQEHACRGTRVIVNGHQAKDGAFRANSSNIEFPDGRKLDTGSSYKEKEKEKRNSRPVRNLNTCAASL